MRDLDARGIGAAFSIDWGSFRFGVSLWKNAEYVHSA